MLAANFGFGFARIVGVDYFLSSSKPEGLEGAVLPTPSASLSASSHDDAIPASQLKSQSSTESVSAPRLSVKP